MKTLTNANKAWVAAVATAGATFVATIQGRTDVDTMGAVDWLIVVVSAIVAGLVTYTVPNTPAEPVQVTVAPPAQLEDNEHLSTE